MRRAAVTPLLRIATWQGYNPVKMRASCSMQKNEAGYSSSVRCQSSIAEAPLVAKLSSESAAPPTETLLKVDWILQNLTPLILKSNVRNFIDICKDDVQFEDRLFKYNLSSRSSLMSHIAKVRMYYRYLSPFNKVEWIGSCVYENEDVVVVLWRLTTLQSNFWSYFPSFITNKEQKMIVKEGALDVHLGHSGHVQKIVNRMITASDREGAKSLAKLKAEQEETRIKEEEKEMRKEFDRQYHS